MSQNVRSKTYLAWNHEVDNDSKHLIPKSYKMLKPEFMSVPYPDLVKS